MSGSSSLQSDRSRRSISDRLRAKLSVSGGKSTEAQTLGGGYQITKNRIIYTQTKIPDHHQRDWNSRALSVWHEFSKWVPTQYRGIKLYMSSERSKPLEPCLLIECWDDISCDTDAKRRKLRKHIFERFKQQESIKNFGAPNRVCPFPHEVWIDHKTLLAGPGGIFAPKPEIEADGGRTPVSVSEVSSKPRSSASTEGVTNDAVRQVDERPRAMTVVHEEHEGLHDDTRDSASAHDLDTDPTTSLHKSQKPTRAQQDANLEQSSFNQRRLVSGEQAAEIHESSTFSRKPQPESSDDNMEFRTTTVERIPDFRGGRRWDSTDPRFIKRRGRDAEQFFCIGRVMALATYQEGTSQDAASAHAVKLAGRTVMANAIRAVVVSKHRGYVITLPINAYGGRGTGKRRFTRPEQVSPHAIIHDINVTPQQVEAEKARSIGMRMDKSPIAVHLAQGATLSPASRVNFGIMQTIEMNVRAMDIGLVAENCHNLLQNYWREHMGQS